jgi:hypothetical protein
MVGGECCCVFCVAPLAESTQTTVIFSNALTEPRRRGLVLLGPHEQAGLRNPTAESSKRTGRGAFATFASVPFFPARASASKLWICFEPVSIRLEPKYENLSGCPNN